MRVLRLDLLAFGPFSNGRIDFSKKERALQLVYGPNEAGKSTTLRALLALLYGIPLRSEDAHVHDTARLRVGASFADERGRIVNVVRRKGLKNTLLDAAGEPLSEGVMSELLHGIDETMFRNMFGLDHDRLREGAEALLAGAGNLGEGLFSASLGTRTLRDLKETLRGEAEALYKPRGKTPKLNIALESLREKLKKKRDDALSPSAYAEQTKALEAGERERAKLLSDRHALLTERADLGRKLDFLPSLARHAALTSELSQLSGKGAPEASALPEELMRDLERRYGVALSAEAELPTITQELVRLEQELSLLRARLGSAALSAKPIDTPQRTRLRRLSEEATGRARRALELRQSQTLLQRQFAELAQDMESLAPLPDVAAELALLESIERESLIETHKRLEEEYARASAQVSRAAAPLGLALATRSDAEQAPDSVEALCARLAALSLPIESELAELERVEQALEHEGERAAEKGKQLEAQRKAIVRARGELLVDGELATLSQLNAARIERDRTFALLLSDPSLSAVARYRDELSQADALSDRLRRELSASHDLSRLAREEALRADQEAALNAELAALEARRAAHAAEATRLLSPLGVARARVRGVRAKLAKLEALRDAAGSALADHAVLQTVRARTLELRRVLEARLSLARGSARFDVSLARGSARFDVSLARGSARFDAGETSQPAELSDLLALLRARVLSAREQSEQQKRRLNAQQELTARLTETEVELDLLLEADEQARLRLANELAEGGFAPTLSHDEVLACLDDLSLLHERERQRAMLRARKESTEAQATQLSRDVADAVRRFVPAAEGLSIAEQLTLLARSERGAREALRDETRFAAERAALEAELLSLGDGAPIEQLRARVLGLDPSAARARLFELDASIATLEEEIGALDQQLGRLKAGADRLLSAPFAVEVAEDVESELGNARTLLRRYVEVKLSLTMISREVERHRQKHQDPLLARASLLFSRLTLGRYSGLQVELDERDEPFLCALHKAGKTVRVSGLSDGTRDQLYLALRVASIERFCAQSSALPLVLDDAFIHFDDARAEAALQVLGELCEKTQVLFFTHHARMIELAKRALKASQLAVHELDPVRGTVSFRDNGPLFADA